MKAASEWMHATVDSSPDESCLVPMHKGSAMELLDATLGRIWRLLTIVIRQQRIDKICVAHPR